MFATYTFPFTGFTAMLNSTVPTPETAPLGSLFCAGTGKVASMAKTSSSGSENITLGSQLRSSSSYQCDAPSGPVRYLTIRPAHGAGTPDAFSSGAGSPPLTPSPAGPLVTVRSCSAVVRLPEWKAAAYTVVWSFETASARGVSANNVITVTGVPAKVLPSDAGSNTQTSARPTPGIVNSGSRPVFCPRCAVVM